MSAVKKQKSQKSNSFAWSAPTIVPKWLGNVPGCDSWNSLQEQSSKDPAGKLDQGPAAKRLSEVDLSEYVK